MNNKITFQDFASLLAEATASPKKLCEDFLREFISVVSESLTEGENVKIKGFGTFKIVEIEERKSVNIATGQEIKIPVHYRVSFVPAKELSNAVNSPFANFETIEIDESISDEDLEAISAIQTDYILEEANSPASTQETNKVKSIPADDNYVIEEENVEPEKQLPKDDEVGKKAEAVPLVSVDEGINDTLEKEEKEVFTEKVVEESNEIYQNNKGKKFGRGFIWGFLSALVLLAVAYFAFDTYMSNSSDTDNKVNKTAQSFQQTSENNDAQLDTLEEEILEIEEVPKKEETIKPSEKAKPAIVKEDVNTAPSDKVIYDHISPTRYLTTLAKEYYGNFNYWPYIYEENKSILGHPDRIKPGTKVVVPPLSKYVKNPDDPKEVDKAKKLGFSIYSKFNKTNKRRVRRR